MFTLSPGCPHGCLQRSAGQPASGPTALRRQPEKTPLFRVVAEHLESWLEWRFLHERPVPAHVEEEFREYLRCGILCFGFARA